MTAISDKAAALEAAGFGLGPPIDATEQSGPGGGKYRRYTHATIYWTSATGAHECHGDILATYNAVFGGPGGPLGYPLTDETGTGDMWGRFNNFQHDSLYWDARYGYPAYRVKAAPAPCVEPGAGHGHWETPPFNSGVVGVHAALMKGNKVLFFTYLEPPPGTLPSPQRYGAAAVVNFTSGYISYPTYSGELGTTMENLFCSAHAFLEDGRLLVAGGERDAPGVRSESVHGVHVFAPAGGLGWTCTQVASCSKGRWYPQCATLPDGRVVIVGGNRILPEGNFTYEIFDPNGNTMTPAAPAPIIGTVYPFLFVLPSRKLMVHVLTQTKFLDLNTLTWDATTLEAAARPDRAPRTYGQEGSAVLLPLLPTSSPPYRAKVLVVGGGGPEAGQNINTPSTNTCEILDLGAASPSWQLVAPMARRRVMPDAVLLPDGKVFVCNGSSSGRADLGAAPVYEAEIYDPAANTWTTMCHMTTARLYHATALLLPDGRVMSAGTDSAWNPEPYNQAQLRIEIFSPPYLFAGARPTITTAPSVIDYDDDFTIETPDAAAITKVSLMRCGSATHSFNTDQRHVGLVITARTANTLTLQAPPDGAIAPPGYYLLFILNGAGVPSVAKYVRLRTHALIKFKEKDIEKIWREKFFEKDWRPEMYKRVDEGPKTKDAEGYPQGIPGPSDGPDMVKKLASLETEVASMRAFIRQFERPAHEHKTKRSPKWPVTTSDVSHENCEPGCTIDHSKEGEHAHVHSHDDEHKH